MPLGAQPWPKQHAIIGLHDFHVASLGRTIPHRSFEDVASHEGRKPRDEPIRFDELCRRAECSLPQTCVRIVDARDSVTP